MHHAPRPLAWHRPILALLLLLPLLPAASAGVQAAAPVPFADGAVGRVWTRTEGPVAAGDVVRSWVWGPQSWAAGQEPYAEAPGGARLVQYFDKGRMEINNPTTHRSLPGYVTNGLLVVEMVRGAIQVGDTAMRPATPAGEPVVGDPRAQNPDAPDYAAFRALASLAGDHEAPDRSGTTVDSTLSRSGVVGRNAELGRKVRVAQFNNMPGLRHNIPDVFWTYLPAEGPLLDGGRTATGPVLNWPVTVGYPITEAYWTRARVGGTTHDILVQLYQRRVLTYDPLAPAGWQVQMGNVGQHYYHWRYEATANAPPLRLPTLPRYAVDTRWQSDAPMLQASASTGTGLARIGLAWVAVEPLNTTPDRFHWEAYDSPLTRISTAGLAALVSINECPPWACTHSVGPLDQASPDDMAAFMRALVSRYSRPPYNVHNWELFNEPDQTHQPGDYGWGHHSVEYAAMLKAVVPAMRAADPQARIFLGGLAYDWFTTENGPFVHSFLADILSLAPDYFDYANFHYYPQNIHWPTIAGKVAELEAIMDAANVHKPLVCTETGLTSSTNPEFRIPNIGASSPALQARWLVQVHAQGFASGVEMITWFTTQDFDTDVAGWQIFTEAGLLRRDGSPKPVYNAYQTWIREIGDAPYARQLSAADLGGLPGAEGYEFTRPDGRIWVLWGDGSGGSLALPGTTSLARDLYGRPLTGLRVPLGRDPIYIQVR